MNRELLGLSTSSPVGGDGIFNSARIIRDHWKELVAGQNLDRKRLFDETQPPKDFGNQPDKMSNETLAKISAASVQIGDVGKKPTFSGVIIPGGYVVTCAHHGRLIGTEFMVTIPDGRSAKAVVLGANWLNDTCVLKMVDDGAWPTVELGYSSDLAQGESVVLVGYPMTNEQQPLVLETRVKPQQRQGLKRRDSWGETLYTVCDKEQIVQNLRGASGGGLFDRAGNVVGILSSTNLRDELTFVRVELFHKNWMELIATNTVEEIDSELRKSILPSLKKLNSELAKPDPKP